MTVREGLALTLAVTDAPTEAERGAVLAGLQAYNAAFVGPDRFASTPLGITLRDPEGVIVGGLIGRSGFGRLFIDLLHVAPAARRTGLGTKLLAAAEDEARARGCVGVRLDTFSFQAPGFYARHGYTLLGTLPDYPPGHARHLLFKRLDGGPTCST